MPEILEVEEARALIEQRALRREIESVHAPDAWFLKRGLTPQAAGRVLDGERFTGARRRGKWILLDTDGDHVLGLHLGMSGRVLVDDDEAGDPLVYASNRDETGWRRFGVVFIDGGAMYVRDPRRLGAVELDLDEARLGVDAFELDAKGLDEVLGRSTAPIKARLMDQARLAGLGNLLTDEACWRAGLDPARLACSLDDDERRTLLKAIRQTLRTLARRGGSHTGDMPRSVDEPCPRDGTPLQRGTVGGRTTYWCPEHQR